MKNIYNISIYFFEILIHIFSLFHKKSRLWVEGRKDIFLKLKNELKNHNNIVWFHCASLGEYEQAKPVIIAYKKKYPNHEILLTFFSPSGYHQRKNITTVSLIFYLPIDTINNARKFISIVQPIKAIFIKYEFWFNYLIELKKKNITTYSIASVFRKNQYFFKVKWFARQLGNFTHFYVQDDISTKLLKNINIHNSTVIGDTRFDTVIYNKRKARSYPIIENFSKNKHTIIFGSIWEEDLKIILNYIKNHSDYNYIIAPHELSLCKKLTQETNGTLYSQAKRFDVNNVLIIDCIGILSSIYKYAKMAYIGGGFGKGIHNILEAVTYGVPVVFGPNYLKFNEAVELINDKGAISISNYNSLVKAFKKLEQINSEILFSYIQQNAGATSKLIEKI